MRYESDTKRIGNYGLSNTRRMLSILTQALKLPFGRLLDHAVGHTCLLCRSDCRGLALCPECTADLPLPPPAHCPLCGEQTTHGERCGACLKEAPHFDRATAAFIYDFPVDRLIHALKYGHQLAIARWLASRITRGIRRDGQLIIPLPLHPERLRERGFNQSMEIAREIGKQLQLPVDHDALARTRPTASQAGLALKERRRNVKGAFECSTDFTGRHILLIDDVMTSGATANECARVLKLHGASEVSVAVAARAQKGRSML